MIWCLITVAAKSSADVVPRAQALIIPLSLYFLIGHTLQTFRALEVTVLTISIICLFLAAVGVHQGMSGYGCHQLGYRNGESVWIFDGRECEPGEKARLCESEATEPGDYTCEHVGLFGTQSVFGRVRFRGTLQDPNDLALTLGVSVPFAFGFLARRRSFGRMLRLVVTCVLVGACAVFTQSRGGQLVFLTVIGVYFIRRYGVRGVIVAACFALPILLFGGREGGEDSTIERTECWYIGMRLFWSSPLVGVGSGLFTDHHFLTAHNSYVLSSAELGFPGMLLWCIVLWISVKIPIAALRAGRRPDGGELAPVGQAWSLAFLGAMAGMVVGIFFLSWTYKEFLWIYIGLTGVLYHAIRRHDPTFRVKFGRRDLGLVVIAVIVLQVALTAWTTWKVGSA